jgi:hypothetical protein
MKISGKISNLFRLIALLIGLLSISISAFEYRIEDRISDEIETTGQDDEAEPGDAGHAYLPDYQATISSFQLHLENLPCLLGYIPVLISVRVWVQTGHPLTELNFFRTLFQHIIAPNAP